MARMMMLNGTSGKMRKAMWKFVFNEAQSLELAFYFDLQNASAFD